MMVLLLSFLKTDRDMVKLGRSNGNAQEKKKTLYIIATITKTMPLTPPTTKYFIMKMYKIEKTRRRKYDKF